MLDRVGFRHNIQPLAIDTRNGMGQEVRLVIQAGEAQIDDEGVIRSFTLRWSDGVVTHYKLVPNAWSLTHVVELVTNFLAGFALSRGVSGLIKGTREVDHLTRYTVGTGGRGLMNSFRKHDHRLDDCGYRNVVTHELVFPQGAWHAPDTAW